MNKSNAVQNILLGALLVVLVAILLRGNDDSGRYEMTRTGGSAFAVLDTKTGDIKFIGEVADSAGVIYSLTPWRNKGE